MVSRWRVIEAELWGVHKDVYADDSLAITSATGAYGTLYEIELYSSWALWRASAVLTDHLPSGVELVPPEGEIDEDEEFYGLVVHFWKDKGRG
jgi:uncharacterized protein YfaS (alpha-2-macroglobulin family)